MTGVSFRYPGSDKDTLKDINVKLALSSRVALTGPNGAGKTTLLRLLVEDLPTLPGVGEVWKHHSLRLSYVAQHSMHHLEANLQSTPIAYLQERFGFGKDKEVDNKVTVKLSPEEKEVMEMRGEIGEVLGRRKKGNTVEYEVCAACCLPGSGPSPAGEGKGSEEAECVGACAHVCVCSGRGERVEHEAHELARGL